MRIQQVISHHFTCRHHPGSHPGTKSTSLSPHTHSKPPTREPHPIPPIPNPFSPLHATPFRRRLVISHVGSTHADKGTPSSLPFRQASRLRAHYSRIIRDALCLPLIVGEILSNERAADLLAGMGQKAVVPLSAGVVPTWERKLHAAAKTGGV